MSRSRRRRGRSPALQRRVALSVIATGALLAGIGAALSDSGSHLLDALGFVVVLTGAALDAKSAPIFFEFAPAPARRRALLLAVVGVMVGVAGCVLASTVFDADAPWPLAGLAMAALVGGIGAGLAGAIELAWFYGGDYAARRIEEMSDEDW